MKLTRICKSNKVALTTLLVITLLIPCMGHASSNYSSVAIVTNGNDSGDGSLRDALEVQEATRIYISRRVSTINILSTLNYNSERALTIFGSRQTIKTSENVTLLAINQGADLSIFNLNFEGPGNFSITNRGDIGQDAGKGIFVDVRDDQTGTVNLKLNNVSVSGVANHGIHVSDCSLADDCGSGSGGGGDGSPASVSVVLNKVSVNDAGNGRFDADGLRVDDRGDGNISLFASRSSFTKVGADGIELDEGDNGNVIAKIFRTNLSDNGGYCDPEILEPFLPDPDEAEFEESDQVVETDIPPAVSGSPDDSCIEREVDLFDSGFVEAFEFGLDLDDGIDFDEAGSGSIYAVMIRSTIGNNLDEGVDFDEENEGNIFVSFIGINAFANTDDGIKLTEEDAGNVYGSLRRVRSTDNGGKGIVLEEEDEGNFFVSVRSTSTSNNDDSDNTGIEAVQEEPGVGKIRIRNSNIADGIDLDGVDEI